MSSATIASADDDRDDHGDDTLFWWCRGCDGAVSYRLSSCFCCGASRPADPERLSREAVERRAETRRQAEEGA